jgi:hypothetical protein
LTPFALNWLCGNSTGSHGYPFFISACGVLGAVNQMIAAVHAVKKPLMGGALFSEYEALMSRQALFEGTK